MDMKIGTVLLDEYIVTPCAIDTIEGIYPLKYDGTEDQYVICDPEVSTHRLIVYVDIDGDEGHIILVNEFKGKETLIDLL